MVSQVVFSEILDEDRSASGLSGAGYSLLRRRGVNLGWVKAGGVSDSDDEEGRRRWCHDEPVFLPQAVVIDTSVEGFLSKTAGRVEAVLDGRPVEDVFAGVDRQGEFTAQAGFVDTGNDQEIVTVSFTSSDDPEGRDDLWMKAAWLSFDDEDPSLRFRFSFGMDGYDDPGRDLRRQRSALRLCRQWFPEVSVVTESPTLKRRLTRILNISSMVFVEPIVYFNGPNGGAQFHHDVERGHLGVVYAQVTGRTFWLALNKDALMRHIAAFAALPAGREVRPFCDRLDEVLDGVLPEALEVLLNRTPAFVGQLVAAGHGFVLGPGDLLLLPQADRQRCVWHSVFCLGGIMGEGLSLAMRSDAVELL